MDLRESVEGWIQWSRDKLPRTGDIPSIRWPSEALPWREGGIELFEKACGEGNDDALLGHLETSLAPDPSDLATRFTAISIYYELCRYQSTKDEDFVNEDRIRHKKNLEYLIRLVSPEECSDWRTIRWEILNSYAMRDWDRATKLYDRAEDLGLLGRAEIGVLRGQFRFLLACEDEVLNPLDSLVWEPRTYKPEDQKALFLAYIAFTLPLSDSMELKDEKLKYAKDAANDLDKALVEQTRFAPVYRALLAACFFAARRYAEAGHEYEQLLDTHVATLFPEFLPDSSYYSTVISYCRAEQNKDAIEVCRRWVNASPQSGKAHEVLAGLLESETDFEGARYHLRKAVELNPEFGQRPGIQSLIALSSLEDSETEKAKLRETPEYKLVDSLLKEYWRPFAAMTQDGQEEWTFGAVDYFTAVSVPYPWRVRRLAKAATYHATSVELELNSKVFSRFRNVAQSTDRIAEMARSTEKNDDKLKTMSAYILEKYPFNKEALTLGAMAFIMRESKESEKSLLQEFRKWANENYPQLIEASGKLDKVNKFRRPPSHGHIPTDSPDEIPSLCREIIEIIGCPEG